MAIIDKKFIHFKNYADFISQAGVGSVKNITTPTSGSEDSRNAVYGQIKGSSIVFIKDTKQIWTHGQLYSCNVDIDSLEDVVRLDNEGFINKDKLIIGEVPSWALEILDVSTEDFVDTDSLCTISSSEDESSKQLSVETVTRGYNIENALEYKINDHMVTMNIKETGGYGTTQYVQTMPTIIVDGKQEINYDDVGLISYTVNTQAAETIQQMCISAPDGIGHTSGVSTYSDAVSLVSMVRYEDEQTGGWVEKGTDLTVTTDGVFVNGTPLSLGVTPITYDALVTLRNNGTLIPGTVYRLTDYECTTTQEDTTSAGHQFDIIVTATAPDTLSEECKAIQNENDAYFDSDNLSAWKIWYALDNDKSRFYWADEENGKGVIYRMIDEYNNDLPYDFKNILYIENIPTYAVNELGTSISLSNPLEISYSLLADTDTEYNTKGDVIVEISQSDETPDKSGQDVWVLYKTDLENEDGGDSVDYADMFVFVDKYEYNDQIYDRWRKAESDGSNYQWLDHNGSAIYILTEELLEEISNEQILRYTFNAEWVEGYDSIDASRSFDAPAQANNNVMKGCSAVPEYTGSQWYLPRNIFIISEQYNSVTHNNFDFSVSNNTFLGRSEFLTIRQACFGNTFYAPYLCTLGPYCVYNTFDNCTCLNSSGYNLQNYFQLSGSNVGTVVFNNHITGSVLTIDSGVLNCVLDTDLAVISPMQLPNKTIIEVPEHSYQVKIAQNSRGEIKIYNEADLIA